MLCKNCGKELKDEWNVCPYCRTRVSTEGGVQPISDKVHIRKETVGGSNGKLPYFSILKFLLLTAVTLGIYAIYTLYRFNKTVNVLCKDDGKESFNYFIVIGLGIVTCGIYYFYWIYKQAQRLYEAAPKYNCTAKYSGVNILLWETFGIFLCVGPLVVWYRMFKTANMLSEQYNNGNINQNYSLQSGTKSGKGKAAAIIAIFYVVMFVVCFVLISAVLFMFVGDSGSGNAYSDSDYTDDRIYEGDNGADTYATPGYTDNGNGYTDNGVETYPDAFDSDECAICGEYEGRNGDTFAIYDSDGFIENGDPYIAEVAVSSEGRYVWSAYITDASSSPIQVVTLAGKIIALFTPEEDGMNVEWRNNRGTLEWYGKITEDSGGFGETVDEYGQTVDAFSAEDGYTQVTTEQLERNPDSYIGSKIRVDASFTNLLDMLMIISENGYIQVKYDASAYDQHGNSVGQVLAGDSGYVEGIFEPYIDTLGFEQLCIVADKVVIVQ